MKRHPAINKLFAEMQRRNVSMCQLAQDTGICVETIKDWKYGRTKSPRLVAVESCLNRVGVQIQYMELKG